MEKTTQPTVSPNKQRTTRLFLAPPRRRERLKFGFCRGDVAVPALGPGRVVDALDVSKASPHPGLTPRCPRPFEAGRRTRDRHSGGAEGSIDWLRQKRPRRRGGRQG